MGVLEDELTTFDGKKRTRKAYVPSSHGFYFWSGQLQATLKFFKEFKVVASFFIGGESGHVESSAGLEYFCILCYNTREYG